MNRPRVTAPGTIVTTVRIRRADSTVAGVELRRLRPLYAWREALAYRERDGTLYLPDYLSTHPTFTVGTERVLVGHGEGLLEGARGALSAALDGARVRFPAALATLPAELRAMLGAVAE